MYLFALIALGVTCYFAVEALRRPRPAVIVATVLWLLYAIFEVLVNNGTLCDEKCNIRIDLFLIWSMLWVASFFAMKTPGEWSPRDKVFGVISMGSLLLMLGTFALIYLEDMDVFFPARRECKLGGEGSVRACDEALRKAPGDFNLYFHRALAHRAKGDHDRAIADMSTVIEKGSKYSGGRTGRGTVYYEKGDIEYALADFDAALKLDPNDGAAFFRRGTAYASKGELDRALADFTKFIDLQTRGAVSPQDRLAPAPGVMFDSRGLVHLRLGNLDKAISDYDAALKLDPKLAGSLYGRGLAKIKKGDKIGGDADTASAKAINAGIAEVVAKFGVK